MAQSNIELARELEEKVKQLLVSYKSLKDKNLALQADNAKLSAELATAKQAYADLDDRFNTYRLTVAVTGDSDATTDAKRRINLLVREIDKCIALLNR